MNNSEEEIVVINRKMIKPLDQCSHDPGYIPDTDFSEWAVHKALLCLPDEVSGKELNDAIYEASVEEALLSLMEKGLVDTFVDEDGELLFKAIKEKE